MIPRNTQCGLICHNHLPFSIIGYTVYLDHNLVTGMSDSEHLQSLKWILQRLEEADLLLNKDKCKFLEPHIEGEGLKTTQGLLTSENVLILFMIYRSL